MEEVKRLSIFGATGMSGVCAVEAALKQGLEVVTLQREGSELPEELRARVSTVRGDVRDPAAVRDAVRGSDGVVVVLGTRNCLEPTTVMSDGLRNILAAMTTHGVTRVSVCLSSFMFWELEKVPERFHEVHADHTRMWEQVQQFGGSWVGVAPPHITQGPWTGNYKTERGAGPGRVIAKQHLGHFLVTCLDDQDNYGHLVGLCDQA